MKPAGWYEKVLEGPKCRVPLVQLKG